MKTRHGLVSNSSSCSFMITNKSERDLTIADFVIENPQLVELFNQLYDCQHTQKKLIANARTRMKSPPSWDKQRYIFQPKEKKCLSFGDRDGDILGCVFDYILRDGGSSDNFIWKLDGMER